MVSSISLQYHILFMQTWQGKFVEAVFLLGDNKPRHMLKLWVNFPVVAILMFIHTGVDYAGPIMLKMGRVRKPPCIQVSLLVFQCPPPPQ